MLESQNSSRTLIISFPLSLSLSLLFFLHINFQSKEIFLSSYSFRSGVTKHHEILRQGVCSAPVVPHFFYRAAKDLTTLQNSQGHRAQEQSITILVPPFPHHSLPPTHPLLCFVLMQRDITLRHFFNTWIPELDTQTCLSFPKPCHGWLIVSNWHLPRSPLRRGHQQTSSKVYVLYNIPRENLSYVKSQYLEFLRKASNTLTDT